MLQFSEWLKKNEALQLKDKKPFKKKRRSEVKDFEKPGKVIKTRGPHPFYPLVNPPVATGELGENINPETDRPDDRKSGVSSTK
jgi:hypothetical protein